MLAISTLPLLLGKLVASGDFGSTTIGLEFRLVPLDSPQISSGPSLLSDVSIADGDFSATFSYLCGDTIDRGDVFSPRFPVSEPADESGWVAKGCDRTVDEVGGRGGVPTLTVIAAATDLPAESRPARSVGIRSPSMAAIENADALLESWDFSECPAGRDITHFEIRGSSFADDKGPAVREGGGGLSGPTTQSTALLPLLFSFMVAFFVFFL